MITELDKAQLRHESREMYKDIGFEGCLGVLTEVITYADILCEVLKEEYDRVRK